MSNTTADHHYTFDSGDYSDSIGSATASAIPYSLGSPLSSAFATDSATGSKSINLTESFQMPLISSTKKFSIACWFRTNVDGDSSDPSAFKMIMGAVDGMSGHKGFRWAMKHTRDLLQVQIPFYNAGGYSSVDRFIGNNISITELPKNDWAHAILSANSVNGEMKMWWNGTLVMDEQSNSDDHQGQNVTLGTDFDLTVWKSSATVTDPYPLGTHSTARNASIDDVLVWDGHALTNSEASALYSSYTENTKYSSNDTQHTSGSVRPILKPGTVDLTTTSTNITLRSPGSFSSTANNNTISFTSSGGTAPTAGTITSANAWTLVVNFASALNSDLVGETLSATVAVGGKTSVSQVVSSAIGAPDTQAYTGGYSTWKATSNGETAELFYTFENQSYADSGNLGEAASTVTNSLVSLSSQSDFTTTSGVIRDSNSKRLILDGDSAMGNYSKRGSRYANSFSSNSDAMKLLVYMPPHEITQDTGVTFMTWVLMMDTSIMDEINPIITDSRVAVSVGSYQSVWSTTGISNDRFFFGGYGGTNSTSGMKLQLSFVSENGSASSAEQNQRKYQYTSDTTGMSGGNPWVSSGSSTDRVWTMIGFTHNKSTNAAKFYINGTELTPDTVSGSGTGGLDFTSAWNSNSYPIMTGGSYDIDGMVTPRINCNFSYDEIGFWGECLTSTQISALYSSYSSNSSYSNETATFHVNGS